MTFDHSKIKSFLRQWVSIINHTKNPIIIIRQINEYLRDWKRYTHLTGSEKLEIINSYPQIFDAISITPFDSHYIYQAFWASEKINTCKPRFHVDIGSQIQFVTSVSITTPVYFIDIRPIRIQIERLSSISGSILNLPFVSNSIGSISCLHVAEHIGLGRYGDELNPAGTINACRELARILAPGGNLFFSLPVGRPRVCFNAHRIHHPIQVVEYFHSLNLIEFSAIDDDAQFRRCAGLEEYNNAEYSCGLFWFTKK